MQKGTLKLVTGMPDSNRDWKDIYFFIHGMDWVCRLEELVDVVEFNNTWGVLDTTSELSVE